MANPPAALRAVDGVGSPGVSHTTLSIPGCVCHLFNRLAQALGVHHDIAAGHIAIGPVIEQSLERVVSNDGKYRLAFPPV